MKKLLALENEDTDLYNPENTDPTVEGTDPQENEYFRQEELSVNEAKEKVDEIRNSEELEEVKEQGEVIEQAMESLQTLMVYRDVLKSNPNISTESFDLAIKHVTAVRDQFGFTSDRLKSLQNNEYDRGIATESITESIASFFRAIKNYLTTLFNKIKAWINKFFGAYVEYNHRSNKTLQAVSDFIIKNRKKQSELNNAKPDYVKMDNPERKFLTINTKQPEDYVSDFNAVTHLVRPNDQRNLFDTCEKLFGAEYFDFCNRVIGGIPARLYHFDPMQFVFIRTNQ